MQRPHPDVDLEAMARRAVRAVARARRRCFTRDEKTGGGYVVGGHGALVGEHRTATVNRHPLPYTRVDTANVYAADAHRLAAPLMGVAASAVGRLWPRTTEALARAARTHPVVGDAFMHPPHAAQRRGLPPDDSAHGSIAVHQCALRLSGVHAGERDARVLRHLQVDPCGLHVDTGDGERVHGVPLVYVPVREARARSLPADAMAHTDLCVFEGRHGGRGCRIRVSHPGVICVVLFRSDAQVHANVFPDGGTPVPAPPGCLLLRIIPYNLRKIDAFCEMISPALWLRQHRRLDRRMWLRVVGGAGPSAHCVCGLDAGGPMVQCGDPRHGGWFHVACVADADPDVTQADLDTERVPAAWARPGVVWVCPLCRADADDAARAAPAIA